MLWERSNTISIEQLIRSSRRWNMGQWGSMWETILGEMHKCDHAVYLRSRPDNSDQDRRFRSDPGFSTFIWWYHHGFDGDGARNHCKFFGSLHQHRVPTVNSLSPFSPNTFIRRKDPLSYDNSSFKIGITKISAVEFVGLDVRIMYSRKGLVKSHLKIKENK